jgi:hypothetical protein
MVTLTKEQIRSLYGAKPNEEVVAFGRNIKHSNPRTNKRNFTHDELMRYTPPISEVQVVESEVQELTF